MKKFYILVALLSSALLTSCASKSGHQFLGKMSNQEISNRLIKGQTTKEEVKIMFGDPSDVDLLPDGKENWVYSYVRSADKLVNYVPYANLVYNGTNDNIKKLKLLFTTSGVLEFFAFSNSQGETKNGLLQ